MKLPLSTVILLAAVQWISGEYLGCYEDSKAKRLLPGFYFDMKAVNSPKRCMQVCQLLQFQYTGVEYGIECYCGNEKPSEQFKRNDGDCNQLCPNSDIMHCGGVLKLSLYSSDKQLYPATEPGIYIGCHLEPDDKRMVNNLRFYLLQTNTPQRCVHICSAIGYLYAGVVPEYCYCGITKPADNRKADESECQVPCPNSQEICGGDGRISAYRTLINQNAESIITVSDERLKRNDLGCFEDSKERRILPEFYIRVDDTNSPKNCLYLCQQLRYQYGGVQNGNECFCGNQMPSPTKNKNENECQIGCPYSSEKCGGKMHIHVYSTQMYPTMTHISSHLGPANPTDPISFRFDFYGW